MTEQRILEVLKSVKREGMDKLISYLQSSTFFKMPSSTRFHCNWDGGLAEHSLNVYDALVDLVAVFEAQFPDKPKINPDSIAIVAICHDLCKIDLYKKGYRNVKNENTNQWERKEIYEHDDKLGMGHGEASVYILQNFIKLTREEALAIRWHMGGFDSAFKGGDYSLGVAQEQFALVTLAYLADMWASKFMEETKK